MDAVTELGEATVSDVTARLPDAPTRNAVRTTLGIMVRKGYLRSTSRGRAKVYRPASSPARAGRRAFRDLLKVFFGGSIRNAVVSYFTDPYAKYDDKEIEEIERVLREIKAQRRKRGVDEG